MGFAAVGFVSYAVDAGLLLLLHGGLGMRLGPATAAGYLVALVINFALNRLVFQGPRAVGRQAARYLALCTLNLGLTLAFVLGLSGLGLNYLIAKTAAVAAIGTANFFACRYWVFK